MPAPCFNDLRSNLGEIYSSLRACPASLQLNLYPLSSSAVAFQGTWMGRIVKWWNQLVKWIKSFFSNPAQEPHLDDVLENIIHRLFQESIQFTYQARQRQLVNRIRLLELNRPEPIADAERIRRLDSYRAHLLKEGVPTQNLQNYLDYFQVAMQQAPLEEGEEAFNRQAVCEFHQATHPFWKIFFKDSQVDLRRPLQRMMEQHPDSWILNKNIYKALRREQRRTALEGILGQGIPVAALSKMESPDLLSMQDKEALRQWIENLNEKQGEIFFKDFARALEDIVEAVRIQGRQDYSLDCLLLELDRWGCQLLKREDPAYMDWREQLKPGDSIECNGKQLILGCLLSPDKMIDDEYKVFALAGEEHAGHVVKLSNNPFKLKMEAIKAQNENEHWGVRSAAIVERIGITADGQPIHGLDQLGRCVVVEKLHTGLRDYAWTSHEAKLAEQDEKIALVLANHLYCQTRWGASSQNLSLDYLLFDEQGVLKSTHLLKKGQPDYDAWELFCHQAAKGNPFVLAFLMHVSKLNEHAVAQFYRGEVEHMIQTGETRYLSQRLPTGYQDKHYQDHLVKLCEDTRAVYENCLKWARIQKRRSGDYNRHQEDELKREVRAKMLALYRMHATPGILPDCWQDKVLESFALPQQEHRGEDAFNPQTYYQACFNLMMAKNQTALAA
ncbi:hypothetical protein [Candidatus Protochlamydia phocaeensis]|uniref:hypothetical protein n=1 Tax=Candidatus Protochlamydia phocaeensis TaxID=1414722 RepID=UPI0008394A30|nr:hypothetical protein [Candidatus Protochlamydia phocaeensis]